MLVVVGGKFIDNKFGTYIFGHMSINKPCTCMYMGMCACAKCVACSVLSMFVCV